MSRLSDFHDNAGCFCEFLITSDRLNVGCVNFFDIAIADYCVQRKLVQMRRLCKNRRVSFAGGFRRFWLDRRGLISQNILFD